MSAGASDAPNPDCAVCRVSVSRIQVDLEKATLKDLVEDILKGKFQYSEDIAVMNDAGLIFDPDLQDNLEKKLLDRVVRELRKSGTVSFFELHCVAC